MDQTYYIYILRCEDNSLYTGITVDVARRLSEHIDGGLKGAKYTRTHKPVALEGLWKTQGKAAASWLEWRIKQLSRIQKDQFLAAPQQVCELAVSAQKLEWTFEVVPVSERAYLGEGLNGKTSVSDASCTNRL